MKKSLELNPKNLAAVRMHKELTFVPDAFDVPTLLETDAFRVRILKASDVDLDYKAVMSSWEHLQGVFGPGSDWPQKRLTKAQDRRSFAGHELYFQQRTSFTYTVMNLDETECLGCVYIYPSRLDDFSAEIIMWVSADAFKEGLHDVLCQTVRKWMDDKWPFEKVIYLAREIEWKEFYKRLGEQDKKYQG